MRLQNLLERSGLSNRAMINSNRQDVSHEEHKLEVQPGTPVDMWRRYVLGLAAILILVLGLQLDLRPAAATGPLLWNAFLGSTGVDQVFGIDVDSGGFVYVSGESASSWGSPIRPHVSSNFDGFVAKMNSSGGLTWNTFIGGTGTEQEGSSVRKIKVDASGNTFVVGTSNATWGTPIRSHSGGSSDAFIAKLDNDGNVSWSTFLGGTGRDIGYDVTIDVSGNVYVQGTTIGSSSPISWGSPVRSSSALAAPFTAKLDPNGNLVWNTFLEGSSVGVIEVNGSGDVYVAGTRSSSWGSPIRAYSGSIDVYVAKLASNGSLIWNTFLGGAANIDLVYDAALGSDGSLYIAGQSNNAWGNPIRAYTFDDAMIAKLDSDGGLVWNTFLGGFGTPQQGLDVANGITVDAADTIYVTGVSEGTWGYPTRSYSADKDMFVATLSSDGNLLGNTFLGGSGDDRGQVIAVHSSGVAYVGGRGNGTWGSPITAYVDNNDGSVVQLSTAPPPDDDGDGIPDHADNCPLTANASQENNDGDTLGDACDADDDNDTVLDGADNCPFTANAGQANNDGDTLGDACDADDDNDTVLDGADNCPLTVNADQANNDGDSLGDLCDADDDNDAVFDGADNCPLTANADQANNDGDALGNACDADDDNDTVLDGGDNCPLDANTNQENNDGDASGDACDVDDDNDGVPDVNDNCPLTANSSQLDSDGDGAGDVCDAVFDNPPPVAGDIVVQGSDIVPLGNTVNTSLSFSDASVVDSHTLTWNWGDGSSSAGTVTEATHTVTGSHIYTAVGVYTVSATLHDSHGGVDDATYEFVVVYDPNGKSVRGNGEIVSPPGACTLSPNCNASTTGSASVGFASKYRNGKTTPDGRTRFVFRAGDLTFVADLQDWLVVSGHKAQFKGTGEINGAGNYGFMVTAVDADLTPVVGDLDRFRIKIWDKASSTVVYDNNRGAADDAEPTTNLARGNVEIVR